jgi:ATP-dependent helicase/nuclease subunit A
MELEADPAGLSAELAAMLEGLSAQPLAGKIAAADVRLAELSLVYDAGPATLRGQIDLLYRDAAGRWHVVDYKSDRVDAGEVAERARRYELQMMVYLSAASRQFGGGVTDATLYFLRPGAAHVFAPDAAAYAAFGDRLADLAGRLARSRADGDFPRAGDAKTGRCAYCPYADLCGR